MSNEKGTVNNEKRAMSSAESIAELLKAACCVGVKI